jgi:hypothetical protein
MVVNEVEINFALTAGYDAKAMVVDDKWRRLLHKQSKHHWFTMEHRQFIADIDVLADLLDKRSKDIPHSGYIH